MFDIIFLGSDKDKQYQKLKSKFPTAKNVLDFSEIKNISFTKMYWLVYSDLEIFNDFEFIYEVPEWDSKYVHVFKNKDNYDGLALIPRNKNISKNELDYRFFVDKKEVELTVSKPCSYDFFMIDTYEEYLHAMETSQTEMFWMSSNKIEILDNFHLEFYFSHHDQYNRKENHVFLNSVEGDEKFDGLFLLSKHKPVSKREIEYRHLVSRKEWNITVSKERPYEIFNIETYDDYLYAMENSKTEMFWATTPNIDTSKFNFDVYFNYRGDDFKYELNENHAFIHKVKGIDHYNGLFLLSKHKPVSKREIEYRHLVSRKEWNIVASTELKYEIFNIETYDDYLYAMENSKTEMFWATTPNIDTSKFNFDVYFTHDDLYNRFENHAFIHKVKDIDYYNGLFLLSKHKPVSKREIEYRHLVSKKEWNIVASVPVKYEIFNVETYDDYLHAMHNSKTEMFWTIHSQINLDSNFNFDVYFTHDDLYNRSENHVFVNLCNAKEKFNGVALLSKKKEITKREIEHQHIVSKKEYNIIASRHKPYDVVFISYNEPNADINYKKLLDKSPNAKRVHGVKGIHNAHIAAAELCNSEMFWIVDADAVLVEDFDFDLFVEKWNRDTVFVWKSKNPINNLTYGYGGLKLFPRFATINMDTATPDMTTSISSKFEAVDRISNITDFNTDPFNTWKSAFRECCKLSSKIIDRQEDEETEARLDIWCSQGIEKKYGQYCIAGANQGREFGLKNKNNVIELKKINNFDWLYEQFSKYSF